MCGLDGHSHKALPDFFAKLGMPQCDDESVRLRIHGSFDAVADKDVPKLAKRILALYTLPADTRNQIHEILWKDVPAPGLPPIYVPV